MASYMNHKPESDQSDPVKDNRSVSQMCPEPCEKANERPSSPWTSLIPVIKQMTNFIATNILQYEINGSINIEIGDVLKIALNQWSLRVNPPVLFRNRVRCTTRLSHRNHSFPILYINKGLFADGVKSLLDAGRYVHSIRPSSHGRSARQNKRRVQKDKKITLIDLWDGHKRHN